MGSEWPIRTVSFDVPHIDDMSDEALRLAFPRRDGRWSALVAEALAQPGVECLDLNAPWAETAPYWACPCCHRPKSSLLRISKTGTLMAHLHRHHDHLHEYIAHRLQERFGTEWAQGIPRGTYHLEHLGSQMIERFEPTIICQDCNGADAFAKRSLPEIDRYFSFRPDEIRQFITPVANQSHRVDLKVALGIWRDLKPDFEHRLAFGDTVADLVAAGRLVRSSATGGRVQPYSPDRYALEWLNRDGDEGTRLRADAVSLEARSISRDGAGRNAQRTRVVGQAPTDEELAAYDGGRYPQLWKSLSAEWRCPGCARGKRAILRRSSKGRRRWSGFVQTHREYEWAYPPTDDDSFEPTIIHHRDLTLCDSCGVLGAWLKQRRPEFSDRGFGLQLVEISGAITVADNLLHQVDIDRLAEGARTAADREDEVKAYEAILAYVLAPRSTYQYFLAAGGELRAAWRMTVDRHREGLAGETWAEADRRLRDLLRQADERQPLPSGPMPDPPR